MTFKIPPLMLALLFALLMWAIGRLLPWASINLPVGYGLSLLLLVAGAAVCGLGLVSFRRKKTTVNPLYPERATALVTSGIYRVSRNPMYLGFAMSLLGWGLLLGNVVAVALVVVFVFYLDRCQIPPEEHALLSLFGDTYQDYCAQVRRWL